MKSKPMFPLCRCRFLTMAFAIALMASRGHAQSPPTEGLHLWLNAEQLDQLKDGDPVAVWTDQSGSGRHVAQSDRQRQPQLVVVGDHRIVRFDGENDFLRYVENTSTGDSRNSKSAIAHALTVFLVVSAHENPGQFRGFLSAGAVDGRDYETGFNIDMGPGPSDALDVLNIEGRGFGGARDLLDGQREFNALVQIEFVAAPQAGEVQCFLDAELVGKRPWQPAALSLEQLTIGARSYTNGPGLQQPRGNFRGDLAEVLVYDRALDDEDRARVRRYLTEKHAELAEELPPQLLHPGERTPLVKVDDPPLIQMLMPGFRIRELPVSLTNVNNVRFRDDGKLVTLGYNGDIHLLSDSDGDGLEDHQHVFWKSEGRLRGPIGLALTPTGYSKGRGLFVPSKGKVSFIVDDDADDIADREIIVASGWQEIPQNVDAVGIAMDREGAIYFGLGTANYANAYLVDEQGRASYSLESERGTVQRVSADFSQRETVCTGVRFPVAFAFNSAGDLFCTDQEGATWLPNGNPFDELLQIQTGRHYGFPPRHPIHNPGVIDEPSTFDFGPQHQSTCGMVFNLPAAGGSAFGPAMWHGDAIVCGESRGKIWRTQLVPTPHGYVAQSQLLACLQMLTVDACVAPNGDLVVACHSGPPDWGTGPTGIGKLFRVQWVGGETPIPVNAWFQTPQEMRIAFNRPLDPLQLSRLRERIRIEYGSYVRPGDRFEHLVPPYTVVRRQSLAPRFRLPVGSATITRDLRTIIVHTAGDPGLTKSAEHHFAVSIPLASREVVASGESPHVSQVDVAANLHGVAASWQPTQVRNGEHTENEPALPWSGWLPHADLQVAQAMTRESREHEELWKTLRISGTLNLEMQLDLHDFLRPRIQPGATLDHEWPEEEVTLVLHSVTPLQATTETGAVNAQLVEGRYELRLSGLGTSDDYAYLKLALLTTQEVTPALSIAAMTNEDPTLRPLPVRRFLMPWAVRDASTINTRREAVAELEGGNWGRGRRVFQSQAAGCFKCHSMRGIGSQLAPDLANLIHRDYHSVLRDIRHPSFAINPDYLGQTVELADGRVLTGVVLSEDRHLLIGGEKGETTRVSPEEVVTMRPLQNSVMPQGLIDKLNPDQLRDLMTYLLTPPPAMPTDGPLKAPPLRTREQVASALADASPLPDSLAPLSVVLVAGPKDHGPGEHDYPAWQVQWGQLMAAAENAQVSAAWEFPSDQQLDAADVLVFFQKGAWNEERAKAMDAYFLRGGGAVYLHWAVNGDDLAADFSKRIGLASRGGSIRYRHGPLRLDLHNTDHPILRNLETLQLYDESYWLLSGAPENVTLLASSVEDGAARPQVWAYEREAGRVFVSIPGHYSWTFDDPLFRILLLRGIAWTARQPVDRFNELVPLGARMQR